MNELRIEEEHPRDVPFLFERANRRAPGAALLSGGVHLAAAGLILFGLRFVPASARPDTAPVRAEPHGIVWLASPGAAGGGGGGGNGTKGPIRRVELPGRDGMTVPVAKPRPVIVTPQVAASQPVPAPSPEIPRLDISALAQSNGSQTLLGLVDGVPNGASLGPGSGRGAGAGNGNGMGNGVGNGLGDGYERGYGGGQPGGAGVEAPRPIFTPRPEYTDDAVRAKIEGEAIVECLVMPDGTVTNARITRSIDPRFGLDQQAIRTALKWRFIPARRHGQPVPMLIEIHVAFSLL